MEEKCFEYPIRNMSTGEKFCHAVFRRKGICLVRKEGGKKAEISFDDVMYQMECAKEAAKRKMQKKIEL